MDWTRLVGLAEIAEMAAVSKRTATRYAAKDDFPTPLVVLAMGPVWDADAVQCWLDSDARKPPGRPARS